MAAEPTSPTSITGHVIYEPDLEREIMRRNLEWFRRWLRP
jgi:hypothetical protein